LYQRTTVAFEIRFTLGRGGLRAVVLPPQQFRQLGDVDGDAPGLVAGEQLSRRSASRLVLEIDIGERSPVPVADDVALSIELGVWIVDAPGRREAAGLY
jgi:hypothetical protein